MYAGCSEGGETPQAHLFLKIEGNAACANTNGGATSAQSISCMASDCSRR